MKGLLCAVMVGTKCVIWHPAGTVLSSQVDEPWRRPNAIRESSAYDPGIDYSQMPIMCKNDRIARKIARTSKVTVYWSCRQDDVDLTQAQQYCARIKNPLTFSYAVADGTCKRTAK